MPGTTIGAVPAFPIGERPPAVDACPDGDGKYRLLFQNMAEGFALYELVRDGAGVPVDWRVLEVNEAYARHTGVAPAQVVGRRAGEVFPDAVPEYLPRFARVVETQEPLVFETYARHVGRYQSVTTFAAGGDRFASTITDISGRKRAEVALDRAVARYELLAATAARLLAAPDPEAAVQGLCSQALSHLGCQVFFNFLADAASGRLRLNGYAGVSRARASSVAWLDYGTAVCGCVARDGERIVAENIPGNPDERTALVGSWGVRAYACHPIRGAGGAVLGTLSFGSRTRERFAEEDLALMQAVTDLVAVALERKRAMDAIERANEGLERRVEERTEQLRTLVADLAGLEQRERLRLAEYLHDNLQQLLVGAKLALGAVQQRAGDGEVAPELDSAQAGIAGALKASRALAADLCPPALFAAGLGTALAWLKQRFREEHGLHVHVEESREAEIADEAVRRLIFESVRELLRNVVRHAGAGEADVRIMLAPGGRLRVAVRDRGRGFEPAAAPVGGGLSRIRQRMENLGGAMEVRSAPDRGTLVTLTFAAGGRPPSPAARGPA